MTSLLPSHSGGDRVAIGIYPPFSTSLITLMVTHGRGQQLSWQTDRQTMHSSALTQAHRLLGHLPFITAAVVYSGCRPEGLKARSPQRAQHSITPPPPLPPHQPALGLTTVGLPRQGCRARCSWRCTQLYVHGDVHSFIFMGIYTAFCSWRCTQLYVHGDVHSFVFMRVYTALCSCGCTQLYVHGGVHSFIFMAMYRALCSWGYTQLYVHRNIQSATLFCNLVRTSSTICLIEEYRYSVYSTSTDCITQVSPGK